MHGIRIKNVTDKELQVFQQELYIYHQIVESSYKAPNKAFNYIEAIIEIDIAFRLWYLFRSKIESRTPNNGFNIKLRASEAAILLKCCLFDHGNRSNYQMNVLEKYKLELDQQLKSL